MMALLENRDARKIGGARKIGVPEIFGDGAEPPLYTYLHRTAVILSSVLEIVRRRKLAFELVREIDESDVCMKFERKALKTKTVIACQRISLDGDHFGRRSWKPWIAERPT